MDLLNVAWCGSYLAYLPKRRGGGNRGEKSRRWCYALKQGKQSAISKIAGHIGRHPTDPGVDGVLGEDVLLIPMPRSAPRRQVDLWPAELLAKALVAEGLGAQVLAVLERTFRVQKSAFAQLGRRPKAADHLASFKVIRPAIQPERITVVDDVITTGATMLAAISAVSDAVPDASVRGFAFIRTQSTGELEAIRRPTLSCVDLLPGGLTHRRP